MATRIRSQSRGERSSAKVVLGAALLLIAGVGLGSILRGPAAATQAPVLQPAVVAEFDTVLVPVPAEYVPAGRRVKEIRFTTVSFPRHQVPPRALLSTEAIAESVTIAALPAQLPLFAENFAKSGGVNPVVERIPDGMRAMTVRVDATAAVEGWAGTGATVDVLLIEADRTTVVAEKVKILSAERSVSPVEGQAAPSVPSTVTLLVTQEQCLAINTAVPRGRIAFALRSMRDEARWDGTIYTADRLRGASVVADKGAAVTGYVAIKGEGGAQTFALADGRWSRTEVAPQGFLVAQPTVAATPVAGPGAAN